MTRKKVSLVRWILCIAIAISACKLVMAVDSHEAHRRCHYGPSGVCVPRRLTYGYYATRWSKWPQFPESAGPGEEKAPEEIPAPAGRAAQEPKTTEPKTPPAEGEEPGKQLPEPDAKPGKQGQPETKPEQPSTEEDLYKFFPQEETPQEPQKPAQPDNGTEKPEEKTDKPAETPLPSGPSLEPSKSSESDRLKATPAKSSTQSPDPFEDEPTPRKSSFYVAPQPFLQMSSDVRPLSSPYNGIRWRTNPLSPKRGVGPSDLRLRRTSAQPGLQRLPAAETPDEQNSLSDENRKANPLRGGNTATGLRPSPLRPVVTAAAWSRQSEFSTADADRGGNPLRSR